LFEFKFPFQILKDRIEMKKKKQQKKKTVTGPWSIDRAQPGKNSPL
jgi:hypothetical protein